MIRSLHELREHVSRLSPKTIAVAVAESDHTLRAVGEARRRGWADAVLVGDEAVIRQRLESLELELDGFDIVHCSGGRDLGGRTFIRSGEGVWDAVW